MKTTFLLLTILLASCATVKFKPLTGTYPQTPIVIKSEKSFEQTWDALIDMFAQKGLSIRIIDKSSGLLISGASLMTATAEDDKGKILNPNAYIVLAKRKDPASGDWVPLSGVHYSKSMKRNITNDVFGEWNVRIKPDGAGSTINVNITNLYFEYSNSNGTRGQNTIYESQFHSTGKFEQLIGEILNK